MTLLRNRRWSGALTPVLAAVLLTASLVPARADTAAELADAMAEVTELQTQAEAASQRVRQAQADHDDATRRLAELSAEVAAQELAVQDSRQALGRAARASYTAGGMDPVLYLLLADNGEDFAAGAQDLQRVTAAVTADLSENQSRQAYLEVLRQGVVDEEARTARAQQESDAAAAEVQRLLAAAQEREAALERRYAAELEAERQREAARAAEAAAAAQAAVEQLVAEQPAESAATPPPAATTGGAAAAAPAPPGPAAAAPAPQAAAPPATTPGTVSSQRQRIVNFALSQVGGRYVYGSDGPGSYDCSGLVGAAYAAGGVTVPSYTRALAPLSRAIPLSQAQPGDLLFFFGRGTDHVSIYLGNGQMVHAVNPSRGITVDSVSNSWYAQRFSMAGRILP